MIAHDAFPVEPWAIREKRLDLDLLAQSESIFALSNGHLGIRGTLDEGEPSSLGGTYLNGFFESYPIHYPERAFGFPEAGQTIVSVTDGTPIRLLMEDEPLDVHRGSLKCHERVLDLRSGILERQLLWHSIGGRSVRVTSRRLVSFRYRSVAAISYEVEALDAPLRVALQSNLLANPSDVVATGDPRGGARLGAVLERRLHAHHGMRVVLAHTTKASGLSLAAGMEHVVDAADQLEPLVESEPDLGRLTLSATLSPGHPLRIVKFLAYHWSSRQSVEWLRDQVDGSLQTALAEGFEGLEKAQREYLDDFWARSDIEIDGDDELQQAIRFGLFQTLQASARAEERAIAAKGLTGTGYDGHAFWDTESLVLPVLTYTLPRLAREALIWRHSTLGLARQRAGQLGLRGAAFPWRTIRGEECSGYWPAGTAAFHVNASIADAVRRYVLVTGDQEFERDYGVDLLVETARLWASLGHLREAGVLHRRRHRAGRVHRGRRQQRLHEPDGPDEPARSRRAVARHPRRRGSWTCPMVRSRRGATPPRPCTSPSTRNSASTPRIRISSPTSAGTSGDAGGPLPSAPPLQLLRPLPQAGGEAGGPGVRPLRAVVCLHRRGKTPGLRLLRGCDRARLLALGGHPGDRGRRGRPPRPRPRLPRRGRLSGPPRPRGQRPRRPAHRFALGRLAGGHRRLRRAARRRRPDLVLSAPAPRSTALRSG